MGAALSVVLSPVAIYEGKNMDKKEFHKVGDVIELNGKTYIVTFVDGYNFSYAPFDGPDEPAPAEPVEEPVVKRRRKKNG